LPENGNIFFPKDFCALRLELGIGLGLELGLRFGLELAEIRFRSNVHSGVYTRSHRSSLDYLFNQMLQKSTNHVCNFAFQRNHIHFAIGLADDPKVISGMRKSCEVAIEIEMAEAMKGTLYTHHKIIRRIKKSINK